MGDGGWVGEMGDGRWAMGQSREAGEVASVAAATGDDKAQGRCKHVARLGLELVRCDALARGCIETG
jgi:hypothetical protein